MVDMYKASQTVFSDSEQSNLCKAIEIDITKHYGRYPAPDLMLQFNHHAPYRSLLSKSLRYSIFTKVVFRESHFLHRGALSRENFMLGQLPFVVLL